MLCKHCMLLVRRKLLVSVHFLITCSKSRLRMQNLSNITCICTTIAQLTLGRLWTAAMVVTSQMIVHLHLRDNLVTITPNVLRWDWRATAVQPMQTAFTWTAVTKLAFRKTVSLDYPTKSPRRSVERSPPKKNKKKQRSGILFLLLKLLKDLLMRLQVKCSRLDYCQSSW